MSMQRRNFLRLGVAGATAVGGASLLGTWQADAATVNPLATAPTTQFAVGVRQYNWTRGSRKITTFVYYPATGKSGGSPATNAPVAAGKFPVCEFMHGFSSSPQKSLAIIQPLAAAGFIVPAPYFANLNFSDVYDGNQSKDISELLTRTLALNSGSDPLAGHINTTAGLGVSGHSLGGMTTDGLLTAWPDTRITAAIPMSTVRMGTPSKSVHAKVLFMHGDKDTTTSISSARQAYADLPAPKAFLTFKGKGHANYFGDARARNTFVDWMRWALYGDTTARDRLASDAQSSTTTWQFVQS